ncbi:tRNA-uridine aminocarboxypropyltransferase [Marinospirillum alkaliphilum]|uniref:tRNA-uridine aminocarboxypropyltransferase n=1 Tax=Marinospirillum alkaliphilum DSM 21637 TaxID=1122209 RepID=A0A1K1Z7U2_9GAMM|nr:DTW domain-containing protein [Marinospirillum alkaliphilum]SFX70182.1 conserved hypothetical protein [Marinospirillum alkaliphilum DSM 21637]
MTADVPVPPPSAFEQEVRRIADSPRDFPRRPFRARGSFVRRCDGCRMPKDYCICRFRTEVLASAQFWVLMHTEEVNKPTNTARLIGDTLADTRVFAWDRMQPPAELLALLQDPAYQPFIIFPDDQPDYQHRVVDFTSARQGQEQRRPVFLLLDGTWRQARRMFRKSPWMDHLPVLPLRTEQKTDYRLRKPASEQHLCTAEVGIELLKLSGDLQAAEVLQQYFTVFNQGYGAARHQRPSGLTEAMQWLLDYQASASR